MTHQPRPVAFSLFYTTAPLVLTPMRTDIDESLKFFPPFPAVSGAPSTLQRKHPSRDPEPPPAQDHFRTCIEQYGGEGGPCDDGCGGMPAPGSVCLLSSS